MPLSPLPIGALPLRTALRMLVLLHFHTLGYSPLELAFLFLLYEFFGVVTNLLAGWIGSRFGLKLTLYCGLGLQVAALYMLSLLDPTWEKFAAVASSWRRRVFLASPRI